jgi:hypothetical protein
MSDVGEGGGLQIEQDLEYQQRAWTVQRVGRVMMALAVLAALAGLLGPGPLSRASAGATGDPLRLEYERFLRFQTPTSPSIELSPTAAREIHGLERLDQIKYAVLERSGGISIIPR